MLLSCFFGDVIYHLKLSFNDLSLNSCHITCFDLFQSAYVKFFLQMQLHTHITTTHTTSFATLLAPHNKFSLLQRLICYSPRSITSPQVNSGPIVDHVEHIVINALRTLCILACSFWCISFCCQSGYYSCSYSWH